ncbi:MAG: serine acetyltransferase [Comamonadaceae bacterium]|nr:serine acetyltransferase [Comamonadaceae bacterium]
MSNPQIRVTEPDWSREQMRSREWNPGKFLLASLRDYQRYQAHGGVIDGLLRRWAVLFHRLWSTVRGADIALSCQIGGGLLLPHPNGVVLYPGALIGPNCLIFQQVTLGTRGKPGAPRLAGHVDVGAGTKLLGHITVGPHALVGANAVVLSDVPAHGMVVGNPAVVKLAKQAGRQ